MFWPVLMLFFVFWIQELVSSSAGEGMLPLICFVAVAGVIAVAAKRRRPTAS